MPDPVRPYMLGDQIKDRLLTMIMEGELAPGERIVETRIARDLGISQGPVREALRDLAGLGLVDLQPYRGARVREPTLEEHLGAMQVRVELEAMAARLAVERADRDVVDELRVLIDEMRALSAAGDAHGLAIKDTEFHGVVVRTAGNQTLERLWSMLEPFAQTYLTATVTGLDTPDRYAERHNRIVDALADRDVAAVDEAVRSHGAANVAMVREAAGPDENG